MASSSALAARPPAPRYVSYLRVSTAQQGRSGLGLEAQRAACQAFITGIPGASLLNEYVEVESGKRNARPALAKAMAEARLYGATLLIAKLDRLSRDAHFLIGLSRSDLVDFVACDNPHANKLTVGIMALIAEQEREATSTRTKAALQAAKARGTKLGNPKGAAHLAGRGNAEAVATVREQAASFAARIMPIIAELEAQGFSANAIAGEMDARRIPTARGGKWTARAVLNVKARTP
ncbi:MAG: recombinase family protein [Beijerinckiaceae bacterium]